MVNNVGIRGHRAFVPVLAGIFMLVVAATSIALLFTPNRLQPDWYPSIPFQEGTSYTTWSFFSINSSTAEADYQKMRSAGVDWVAINSFGYQANLSSHDIYPGFWSEPRANMIDAFNYAHSVGLNVLYKPMIQVETGEWRARIEYSPEWMQAYTSWLVQCAGDAELGGVEIFCIGCEMNSMQGHSDDVRAMIAQVREVFHGKLTYSANYDAFWYIDWYDAIDMIGVSMYPAMSFSYAPTTWTLVQFWNGFYTRLEALSTKWNLPIAFTEIGAQAFDGASMSPNVWLIGNMTPSDALASNKIDVQELCDIYRSVFESRIWTAPWFKGVYWWIWDNYEPDPAHPENDFNFSPEIPAVLAIINATYTTPHVSVPSDFPFRLLVPLAAGTAMLVIVAWKMNAHPGRAEKSRKEGTSINIDTTPAIASPTRLAAVQGSLVGVFLYLTYAQVTFPAYTVLYYQPSAIAWLAVVVTATFLLSRLLLHYAPRLSLQTLLAIPFAITSGTPAFFAAIGIDGALPKLVCDMALLGIVIVAIIQVSMACSGAGRSQHKVSLITSLIVFLSLLACTTFFDQVAMALASIPIGIAILAISPRRSDNRPASVERPVPASISVHGGMGETHGRVEPRDISLLLIAVLAGLLVPVASSSFNLLYMNLLPLALSFLPPVLVATVWCGVYLLWSRYRKLHASGDEPAETRSPSRSLRRLEFFSLFAVGAGMCIVLTGAPHVIWSVCAGAFLVLLLSALQAQVAYRSRQHADHVLFYFLYLVVLMIGAGTIVHAIKGSTVYTIASPIMFNVVVAINLVVLVGCLILTIVSIFLARLGDVVEKKKMLPRS